MDMGMDMDMDDGVRMGAVCACACAARVHVCRRPHTPTKDGYLRIVMERQCSAVQRCAKCKGVPSAKVCSAMQAAGVVRARVCMRAGVRARAREEWPTRLNEKGAPASSPSRTERTICKLSSIFRGRAPE